MKTLLRNIAVFTAAVTLSVVANARDQWRIVIPTAAAGSTDILSKALAREMAKALDVDVETENLPGKSGTIAATRVAKAAPDSHLLLMATVSSHGIAAGLPGGPGYDPVKDFTPIAMVGTAPYLMVVAGNSTLKSVSDLVTAAKASPLSYSSTGIGGPHHLVGELFARKAGVTLVHKPYKGGVDALKAVTSGEVQTMIPAAILALPKARDGSIRVLATTGAHRSVELPQVPTMAEAGLAGFVAESWYLLAGPPGMSTADVDRIGKAVEAALADIPFKKLLRANGVEESQLKRAELGKFIEGEAAQWGGLVKELGVAPR